MENKIDIKISVVLRKNEEILLVKHKDGEWRLPEGNMIFQDEFEQTAKREMMEKLGVNLIRTKVVCVNNDKEKDKQNITIGVLSEEFEGEADLKNNDEFTDLSWSTIENLPFPVYLPSAKILMNLRKGHFYFPN